MGAAIFLCRPPPFVCEEKAGGKHGAGDVFCMGQHCLRDKRRYLSLTGFRGGKS